MNLRHIEHVINAAIDLVPPHKSFGAKIPHSLKLVGFQDIEAEGMREMG